MSTKDYTTILLDMEDVVLKNIEEDARKITIELELKQKEQQCPKHLTQSPFTPQHLTQSRLFASGFCKNIKKRRDHPNNCVNLQVGVK